VTIPATVPQGSEIPEGLMNNPVYILKKQRHTYKSLQSIVSLFCYSKQKFCQHLLSPRFLQATCITLYSLLST